MGPPCTSPPCTYPLCIGPRRISWYGGKDHELEILLRWVQFPVNSFKTVILLKNVEYIIDWH